METVLAAKDCTAYIDCLELTSDIHRNVPTASLFYFHMACNDAGGMGFIEDDNLGAVIFSSDFLPVFPFFLPSELVGRMAPEIAVDVSTQFLLRDENFRVFSSVQHLAFFITLVYSCI
jgi:hypothetical protein